MPDWVRYAVWWQVYPLGFTGAPQRARDEGTVTHRLDRLRDWLDYAVELGASGLALGPVFASGTHGYDTVDHYRIDPRLGDQHDFGKLLDAAHERGLRVLLDGVFNHVGRDFPAFQRALRGGPSSPEASWFRIHWTGEQPTYDTFEGHDGLVALNHDNPEVAGYVRDVMAHWLAAGADGWRLDAAYAVPPAFWAATIPPVREAYPDAYFVGEVIHGDYTGIVRTSTLDAVTQYELWKAIWSSLNDGNLFELSWALERHNGYLDAFAPLTFVGNHDVTRLASKLADPDLLPHALAILLTTGGTPSIYYGDEQAFRGVKEDRAGGDDEIRPAFPASPAALADTGWPTYRLHQDLIGTRRRHPWLHEARTEVVHVTNTQLAYRASSADHSITVALNLDPAPATIPAPGLTTVLAGTATVDPTTIALPAHGWAIFG